MPLVSVAANRQTSTVSGIFLDGTFHFMRHGLHLVDAVQLSQQLNSKSVLMIGGESVDHTQCVDVHNCPVLELHRLRHDCSHCSYSFRVLSVLICVSCTHQDVEECTAATQVHHLTCWEALHLCYLLHMLRGVCLG